MLPFLVFHQQNFVFPLIKINQHLRTKNYMFLPFFFHKTFQLFQSTIFSTVVKNLCYKFCYPICSKACRQSVSFKMLNSTEWVFWVNAFIWKITMHFDCKWLISWSKTNYAQSLFEPSSSEKTREHSCFLATDCTHT